jgi:signal transduction histidine kinase/CheY-like chemotaxis protein
LVLTHAGEQRVYDLHIYTTTDDKNHALNKVALLVDATKRKQAESENQRLRDKAEMSSRLAAVGEMAAGIAHEINNPLTGVVGFSELLLDKQDLSPDVKEQVKIIADGGKRVRDIVQRMLTFAHQKKPTKTSASINELIETTLAFKDYVFKTANIEVLRHLAPDLSNITVDAGQMQQVFVNLLSNAEYSMKKAHGRGTLTVTTEKLDAHIRISFKDDGTGMDKAIKDKVFNPFYTTKEVNEGTGLGLSISRTIILEHGGTLEVESELGKGASFIITLPITTAETATQPKDSKSTSAATGKSKSARILVVDDEVTVRKLVSTILTNNGYTVDATGDSEEALRKLDGKDYDVVLMDIRMPGMSGMELYAHVKGKYPELIDKFIFITGDTSDASTLAFLESNKLSCITKPFDKETLEQRVNELL